MASSVAARARMVQKAKKDKEKVLTKIMDSTKDVNSRVKSLKTILDSYPADEMKRIIVESGYVYYYVWYDFYTLHVEPELRGAKTLSKDMKDDIDLMLATIEKLMHLMPEKLHSGWHCNSLSAFLKRLLVRDGAPKYRYIGVRIFLAWFQIVRTRAPADMVFLFSTLVPGLDTSTITHDVSRSSKRDSNTSSLSTSSVLVTCTLQDPLVAGSAADIAQQTLHHEAIKVMTDLLNNLTSNITATCWTDPKGRVEAFEFMLNQFKQKYLFKIFQDYNHQMDLYSDNKVSEVEHVVNEERDLIVEMKVRVIHWILSIIPVPKSSPMLGDTQIPMAAYPQQPRPTGPGIGGYPAEAANPLALNSEAAQVAYKVLMSTKENINMCLEILRQGLLLPLKHFDTINVVLNVFIGWIETPALERPVFIQDPLFADVPVPGTDADEFNPGGSSRLSRGVFSREKDKSMSTFSSSLDEKLLRSMGVGGLMGAGNKTGRSVSTAVDPYLPAITGSPGGGMSPVVTGSQLVRQEDALRGGLQNYLQYLFRAAAVLFYIHDNQSNNHDKLHAVRSKVLHLFRLVTLVQSEPGASQFPLIETAPTWHFAIHTLLRAASHSFNSGLHIHTQAHDFISGLLNVLMVTCVMSNLHVPMEVRGVWDELQTLLSHAAPLSPLVLQQWNKTMKFLTTRILAPIFYGVDYSLIEPTPPPSAAGSTSGTGTGEAPVDAIRHRSSTAGSHTRQSRSSTHRSPIHAATSVPTFGATPRQDPAAQAPNHADSFATQVLSSMLASARQQPQPQNSSSRPTSLFIAENTRRKFSKKSPLAVSSALYHSKSENFLYHPPATLQGKKISTQGIPLKF